jgi:hypothetical protein
MINCLPMITRDGDSAHAEILEYLRSNQGTKVNLTTAVPLVSLEIAPASSPAAVTSVRMQSRPTGKYAGDTSQTYL